MFSTGDWRAAGAAQLDDAARVLGSVFGAVPGLAPVISRRPWPFEGTFDAEVVTCRTAAGDVRRVYCKHGPSVDGTRHAAYGHRGGLTREAAVYSYVLEPLGVSAARCIGFRHDDPTDADWLVLEFLEGATPLLDCRRSRGLDRAGQWLGSFHGATEGPAGPASSTSATPGWPPPAGGRTSTSRSSPPPTRWCTASSPRPT